MSPRPRKPDTSDLPPHLYLYADGRYMYERPDGSRTSLGKNRPRAIRIAKQANAQLYPAAHTIEAALLARAIGLEAEATVATVVERYLTERLPELELAPDTGKEYRRQFGVISNDPQLGPAPIRQVSVLMIANFLDRWPPNMANKYRARLSQLWKWAIAKGYTEGNPADATLKKIEKVERQALQLKAFLAIQAAAEPWFRVALDLAIQTLQRRQDLVAMRYEHLVDGRLLVQQKKVERHGTGKIAIRVGPALQEVIDRSRDDIASPFIIHRRPMKMRAEYRAGKDHWTQVKREMLSREFQRLRDDLGLYRHLDPEQRPTFHEIRALGGYLYEQAGQDPQSLMGHTTADMTRHYTDRHKIDYVEVAGGLKIPG